MTPQEKAKELVLKFYNPDKEVYKSQAKKYAIICVDEILYNVLILADERKAYWQEVKQEIEKL